MNETLVEGVPRVEPSPPVRLYRVGDDAGNVLRELTERHVDRAYGLARAILEDHAEAEEATQEALTAAWRQRKSLRNPDCFEAWFTRIVVNVCRDHLRRRARDRSTPLELSWLEPLDDCSERTSARDELDRALAGLDPDHRIVVILRYWSDLTVDDIADRLGVPPGTVKSRLHYSLRSLRSALEAVR